MDADGSDEADTFLIAAAYLWPQHPRCHDSGVSRRHQAAERERVPTGDHDARCFARMQSQQRNHIVRDQNTDQVRFVRGLDVVNTEAIGLRQLTRRVATNADKRRASAIPQVERPGSSLVSIADNRNSRVVQN